MGETIPLPQDKIEEMKRKSVVKRLLGLLTGHGHKKLGQLHLWNQHWKQLKR